MAFFRLGGVNLCIFHPTGEIGVKEDRFQEFIEACNALQLKSMHNYADSIRSEGMTLDDGEPEMEDVQETIMEVQDGDIQKVQIIQDYDQEYQIVTDKTDDGSMEIEVINDGSTHVLGEPIAKKPKRTIKRERVKEEYDPVAAEQVKAAIEDIIQNKISFQQASDKYSVSKTLLWRLAQTSPEYHLNRSATHNPELNQIVLEALKSGETLLSISKRYSVPVSTLHRRKSLLYEQGELPENVRIKQRNRGEDFSERLEQAIHDVNNLGVSQTEASKKYKIPKTTIWRRLKRLNPNLAKPEAGDVDQAKKDMEEFHAFSTSDHEIIIQQHHMEGEEDDDAQVKYIKLCDEDDEEIQEQSGIVEIENS